MVRSFLLGASYLVNNCCFASRWRGKCRRDDSCLIYYERFCGWRYHESRCKYLNINAVFIKNNTYRVLPNVQSSRLNIYYIYVSKSITYRCIDLHTKHKNIVSHVTYIKLFFYCYKIFSLVIFYTSLYYLLS